MTSQPPGNYHGRRVGGGVVATPPLSSMPQPGPVAGCPPGLEYLASYDRVFIEQVGNNQLNPHVNNNKYVVKTRVSEQLYFAVEGMWIYFPNHIH